jgi:hypothetical protein
MNSGQIIEYDYSAHGNIRNRTFDLSDKIETNTADTVELKEIILLDLDYKGNSV